MMPATSPFRLIVDESRETWFVLLLGTVGVDVLSSRPNVKDAPDATSAPHRAPTSAPIRNWRSRLGRSGVESGGPGGGGMVGGSAGHGGGGEGTVKTSAGGGASSGISLSPREGFRASPSQTPPDP